MAIEQFRTDEIVLSNINQDTIPKQVVMQGEKDGRSLTVQVTNGGVIEPQAGLNLNLGWRHRTATDKDGKLIQGLDAFKALDRESGIFRIDYTSSMTQPGTIDAEIQFVTSNTVTKSQPFMITVKRSTVDENAVESESSFTVLQEALTTVSQYDDKINGLEINKAEKRDLNQTQQNLNAISNSKVDKNGNEQVTLPMLSQSVKEAMTGGSVAVVGKDAVNTTNVVDRAITGEKVEVNIMAPTIIYPNDEFPNYDTITKILTIPYNKQGSQMVISVGSKIRKLIPNEEILIDASSVTSGTSKLLYDFDTGLFSWSIWNTVLTSSQTVIATMRGNGTVLSSPYLSITVDKKLPSDINLLPWINVLPSPGTLTSSKVLTKPQGISISNHQLTFNSVGNDWVFILNGKYYANAIPSTGTTLNLTDLWAVNAAGTSGGVLIWDADTKEFSILPYSSTINIKPRSNVGIIAIIRKGGNSSYWLDTPIPWSCEGVFMGLYQAPNAQMGRAIPGGPTSQLRGSSSPIVVDYTTRSMTFKAGNDWVISTSSGEVITNSIPGTGLSLKIPNNTELGTSTSAIYLMFNRTTKSWAWIPYNYLNSTYLGVSYKDPWILIAGIRRIVNSKDQLDLFSADFPFPWVDQNGFLYGMRLNTEYISVPVDAPISNIWHRGYSNMYPENTLISYKASKKYGCNEVEMDLSWTSDGVPVNIHDTTINRTARDSSGIAPTETTNITDITYEDSQKYEYGSFKDSRFKGEKLPTFEEVLRLCKRLNLTLHLDRANSINTDSRRTTIMNIIDKVAYHNIVWYIDTADQAAYVRSMYPKADLMVLRFSDVGQSTIDICKQYHLSDTRNQGRCEVLSQAGLTTEAGVKLAIGQGVHVNCWDADSVDRGTYSEWGVTGFSTNGVNIMQELLLDIY